MTIGKSIIIVILLQIISVLIGLTILLVDTDSQIFQHLIYLSGPITHLTVYSLLLLYFKYSKDNYSLIPNKTKAKTTLVIFLIILLVIGLKLFDLPFYRWKYIANNYFGTDYLLTDYSNYEFSMFRLYRIFDAIILAPFFEEIIFRYYIFGGLLKKYSFLTAMVTSSILFSSIHFENPRNLIPTFIMGLVSATLYFATKKIHFSIILHLIYNSLWVASVVFAPEYDQFYQKIGVGGLFWFMCLSGGLILLFALKKITTTNTGLAPFGHPAPQDK